MSQVQLFARIFGFIFMAVGVFGFIPVLVQPIADTSGLAVTAAYGRLLGIFPVNAVHNLVHIGLGAWGVWASQTGNETDSTLYAQANTILYGILAVLGTIPATNMLFGLAPIYGADALLHAGTALVAGYYGFVAPALARRGTIATR